MRKTTDKTIPRGKSRKNDSYFSWREFALFFAAAVFVHFIFICSFKPLRKTFSVKHDRNRFTIAVSPGDFNPETGADVYGLRYWLEFTEPENNILRNAANPGAFSKSLKTPPELFAETIPASAPENDFTAKRTLAALAKDAVTPPALEINGLRAADSSGKNVSHPNSGTIFPIWYDGSSGVRYTGLFLDTPAVRRIMARNKASAPTEIKLAISGNGLPPNAMLIESSGNQALDILACRQLLFRASTDPDFSKRGSRDFTVFWNQPGAIKNEVKLK